MDIWLGALAALAGTLVGTASQLFISRSTRKEAVREEFLTQAANLVAYSEDFRNRVWEEREGIARDQVVNWDLHSYKIAEARVKILAPGSGSTRAAADLSTSGQRLGKLWRTGHNWPDEQVIAAWQAHRSSIDRFLALAADELR